MSAYALRKDPGGTGQGHNTNYVAAPLSHVSNPNSNAAGRRREDDENLVSATLMSEGHDGSPTGDRGFTIIPQSEAVRRLTPTECCRLQGFPDDWLGAPNVPPDSPRYAALGDAVTVNVAEWIGRRIMEVEAVA